jgi:hypothetical protein
MSRLGRFAGLNAGKRDDGTRAGGGGQVPMRGAPPRSITRRPETIGVGWDVFVRPRSFLASLSIHTFSMVLMAVH